MRVCQHELDNSSLTCEGRVIFNQNLFDFCTNRVCSFGEFKFVEDTLKIVCVQKIFKGCPIKFFAKNVARGNAVQIFLNFPAKRLSIYWKKNCHTVIIN